MERKPEYHTEGGQEVPPAQAYKPLWVHPEIHWRVKKLAKRRGVTIIELIDRLVSDEEKR